MTSPEISVVINTLNEEQNLPFALRSVVTWASDIVVVDMHSTDATRGIATSYGARVFLHEPLGFPDPAREFAVAQARCPWILILDADELVPLGLYQALCRIVTEDCADIVRIPRLNYMFGAAIEHAGWHPYDDKQPRFFRKGTLTTTHEIHRFLKPVPDARIVSLPNVKGEALVHFNYVTLSHFIEKLNRYTSIEAEQDRGRGRDVSAFGALWLALSEWVKRYVFKQGFRDGWRGFYLASLMSFYRIAIAGKIRELGEAGSAEQISKRYAQLAEAIVAQYGAKAQPSTRVVADSSQEPVDHS
jgi:(heptosyl)LPS beta-1,4-glucosyltransferase